MKTLNKYLATIALAVPMIGSVDAAVTFGDGINDVFFNNFENLYRTTGDCTVNTCFTADANDPTGYQKVLTNVANNVVVGDIFAGVINVQNIDNNGSTIYFSAPDDQFTGYFAQEVTSITLAGADPSGDDHLTLGVASTDPFGILTGDLAGSMFALYVDSTTVFSSGGTTASSIGAATDGTLWAGLTNTDGYSYTHTDLSAILSNTSDTQTFLALDLFFAGAAYNLGDLALINDLSETEVGGSASLLAGFLCNAADVASASTSCNQFVGTSEIDVNTAFITGQSPWSIRSDDPFTLFQNASIPEPNVIAMLGLGLLGVSVFRRKMNKL